MKILRFFLLPFLLVVGLDAASDDAQSQSAKLPEVILLGDSIRMNYQAAVVKELEGKAQVWAPKDNCSHTVFLLANLDRWLDGKKPDVVHINVGLHDMYLDAKTGQPRHTLEAYEKNLRAIFAKLGELTDAKIIFAMTTAVNEKDQANSKGYGRVVRRNSDIEIYNARARAVAEERGVAVNDINEFMVKTGPEKILRPSDGIHLSPEGCDLMGARVADVILDQLSE